MFRFLIYHQQAKRNDGRKNGKKWVYYEKYADKEVPADTEIPVEKEDVAETENAENE